MCIFYQDELGCCCLNGFTWDFDKHVDCVKDNYDSTEETKCPDEITVKDAKDMKNKLGVISELIEEYRTSEDYTLARAHITLFKIDTDILSSKQTKIEVKK